MKPFCTAVEDNGAVKGIIIGYIQCDGGKMKQYFSRRAIINSGPLLAEDISDEALTQLLTACKKLLSGKAIYIETRNFEDYSCYKKTFEHCGFKYVSHLNFHVDTTSEEIINQNLGKTRKRYVKTSLRDGAKIIESPTLEEVRQYYKVLDNLYKTRVKTPLFPLSFFEKLYYQNFSRFILIKYQDKIVGGTVCVCLSDYALYEWFVCGEEGIYKHIYPSTLATYGSLCYASHNGCQHFDMMGAGKPGEEYGVRYFKEQFGGKLVEHGRFQTVLNPFLYEIGKLGVKIMKNLR